MPMSDKMSGIAGTNGYGIDPDVQLLREAQINKARQLQEAEQYRRQGVQGAVLAGNVNNSSRQGYSFNQVWLQQLAKLLHNPSYTPKPRAQRTLEDLHAQLVVDMQYPLLTVIRRDMGYRFAAAEAWWILSGRDDVASIKEYGDVARFSDDGETFFGAYGPKVKDQIPHVVKALVEDRDSRQAVIGIWRENPPKSKDIPCTLSLQFLLRPNRFNSVPDLHVIASMRSSDIWLGLPYDVFTFTMVAAYVQLQLQHVHMISCTLGTLTMNLGSSHLYDRNTFDALCCLQNADAAMFPPTQQWLSQHGTVEPDNLIGLLNWAKDMKHGIIAVHTEELPE